MRQLQSYFPLLKSSQNEETETEAIKGYWHTISYMDMQNFILFYSLDFRGVQIIYFSLLKYSVYYTHLKTQSAKRSYLNISIQLLLHFYCTFCNDNVILYSHCYLHYNKSTQSSPIWLFSLFIIKRLRVNSGNTQSELNQTVW
jgi:hypothetical protein